MAPRGVGEPLSKTRMLAGALGLLGVLLVTRPTLDTLSWGGSGRCDGRDWICRIHYGDQTIDAQRNPFGRLCFI